MTGLDTNVLVRYIMQDDARQSPIATRLIESLSRETPGYVGLVSVVEIGWVLSGAYDLTRQQLSDAIEGLLRTQELVVEHAETVWSAVRAFRGGRADFADYVIARSAALGGCDRTVTFDRLAARSGGMTLLS